MENLLKKEIERIKTTDPYFFRETEDPLTQNAVWKEIIETLRIRYVFTDDQFYNGGNSHDAVDLRAAAINAASRFFKWGPTAISQHVNQNHATVIHHKQRHETRLQKRWEYKTMWEHMVLMNPGSKSLIQDKALMARYLKTLTDQRDLLNRKIDKLTSMLTE